METHVVICTSDLSTTDCHAELLVARASEDLLFDLLSGTAKLYLTPRQDGGGGMVPAHARVPPGCPVVVGEG